MERFPALRLILRLGRLGALIVALLVTLPPLAVRGGLSDPGTTPVDNFVC
ncbi:MAG TPA: hypothetical protein VFR34_13720 [Paracoccaceae bacterium]|nr:hypothetical protein [Paracoccaceae bacterium]